MPKSLIKALHDNQCVVPPHAPEQLLHYLETLTIWNRAINLTAITAPSDTIDLHVIDSLIVQPYLHGQRFLDVGTGAGLPGLPLAIANPDQTWVLLDKNGKKTRFLRQVIAELHLTNVTVVHSRAEDFHPDVCFDSILSRALGTIRRFVEATAHLLCRGGVIMAMKGHYPQDEIDDLPDSFRVQAIHRLDIKGRTLERHLVCLKRKEEDLSWEK